MPVQKKFGNLLNAVYIYIYIYIYAKRERLRAKEKERERERERVESPVQNRTHEKTAFTAASIQILYKYDCLVSDQPLSHEF